MEKICLFVAILWVASVASADLYVEANGSGGGWEGVGGPYLTYDDIEATAAGITIAKTGPGYNSSGYGGGSLWQTILAAEGVEVPVGTFAMLSNYLYGPPTLTVSNVMAGLYDLTIFGVTGSGTSVISEYTVNGVLLPETAADLPAGSALPIASVLDNITASGQVTVTGGGAFPNQINIVVGPDWNHVINGVIVVRVPEPATMGLLGLGFAGLAALRRRKK